MSRVAIAAGPIEPLSDLTVFHDANPDAGAIVSFVGKVRAGGGVEALELRHYEPLTLPGMQELARRTHARWDLDDLLIIHRVGIMRIGDPIVLVAGAARHRREAFQAADFVMDYLKSRSWFWKRERVAGAWRWIDPRPEDADDLSRWTDEDKISRAVGIDDAAGPPMARALADN